MRLRIMRKYASNRIMQIMQIMHMIRMAKEEKAKGSRKWLKMDDFFLTIHADNAPYLHVHAHEKKDPHGQH